MAFKPTGYSSASPYLIVDGAQATIDFLAAVFDAKPLRVIPRGNGKLKHGEVRIDDTVIMVADAIDGWPAVPAHVHVYVPDVDATFARALKAGAEPVQEPVRRDDPDKRGGFRDAGGTTWWIGQQVA
ncbi:MAG TPA: VOC family protein [Casimicrobiaceae bacterium]|nr:VOC family protein [Casimicrobiaceae bacterium]